MNIETVAQNLRKTIAGKEMLLETYKNPSVLTKPIRETMTHMLEINIDELKRILQDVEQCAKQASDDSWITNPDRMGGCYAEDELRNEGWK